MRRTSIPEGGREGGPAGDGSGGLPGVSRATVSQTWHWARRRHGEGRRDLLPVTSGWAWPPGDVMLSADLDARAKREVPLAPCRQLPP